jgi:hypothetical protein
MSTERWRELLAAGPSFHPGEPEAVMAKVYAPPRMYIAVRSALRRIGQESRARKD